MIVNGECTGITRWIIPGRSSAYTQSKRSNAMEANYHPG